MSPYRPSAHRRRSLSASASPFPDPHCTNSLWHPPTKRTHSRKDVSRQCDVDYWSRGPNVEKRPRTRFSPRAFDDDLHIQGSPAASSAHRFPCTSDAFDLFPSQQSQRARGFRPLLSEHSHKSPSDPLPADQDLTALHSSAFWELHQSIVDSSEGFVQRMRDWESSGPHPPRQAHRLGAPFPSYGPIGPRGRELSPRTSSPVEIAFEDDDLDSDGDDVLILSGEASSLPRASSYMPPKKRARSLGDMELDSPQTAAIIPPALSHTVASSSTSSLLSLAPPPDVPPLSSREEKAIAALSLALANGAAGINDYSVVREAIGVSATTAEGSSEVGEMWQ